MSSPDLVPRLHTASELLARIGKELAGSPSLDELLENLVQVVVPSFADWCVVDVVEQDFQQHVAVAHVDPAKEDLAREVQRTFPPISSHTSPMRQVLDTGQARYIPNYTLDMASIDGVHDEQEPVLQQLAPKSVISVPLDGRRGRIGVMSFLQSDSDRRFGPDDLDLAKDVADRAALAIENALLHRDTERAVRELQEAEERQRFLAEASHLLDSSLDYEATLDRLAHLVVPKLADWCMVDVLRHGRLGKSIAIAATDPGKVASAREIQRRWPPRLDDPTGVGKVIRTGEPEFTPKITDKMIAPGVDDAEHVELLRALGPWTSGMSVPLRARGKVVGALTLITAESGRTYTAEDLAFAMDLADRAAVAVDNAGLYAAEQQARREAEHLQSVTEQLSKSLAVEDVLGRVASTAAELLGSRVAGVFTLDSTGAFFDLVAGYGLDLAAGVEIRLPRGQSAAGRVLASGQTDIIPDVRYVPVTALPKLMSGEAVGSLVVAPVISRTGPLGVIEVYSPETNAFDEEHAGLLSALAATAATALENARLYSAERRARSEAEHLQTLTEQLGRSMAADNLLDQIAGTAAELLESSVVGVFLLDPSGEFFDLTAGRGLDLNSPLRLPRSRSLAGRLIASGESMAVPDVRMAPPSALPQLLSGETVGALVVAPIISPSGPLGAVEVYSATTGSFGRHHAELLSALAGAAAAVLENSRLYRQRESDLARLATIVDQLPVAVLVVGWPSGEVTLRNRQAEALYGQALQELRAGTRDTRVGRHADGEPYKPESWPVARALHKGEVVAGEHIEVERPDGGRSFVSVNAAPICSANGEILAAVSVHDDISGEEELRRDKDQFLAAAAHDLKTPLTSISGLIQLLQRQLTRTPAPQMENTVKTLSGIRRSTRKMTALIDELLDTSRLETIGSLSLSHREVDLVGIAKTVLEELQPNTRQHSLQLQTDVERLVGRWDEARLERAISNLVANAIKYSPEGGEVRVKIAADTRDGAEWAVLSVSDQGIGIPAGDVKRIFERFQRGSNVPERLSGSGVGLSYVQHVVAQHGGSIAVVSQPGRGSTFTVQLPIQLPAETA